MVFRSANARLLESVMVASSSEKKKNASVSPYFLTNMSARFTSFAFVMVCTMRVAVIGSSGSSFVFGAFFFNSK